MGIFDFLKGKPIKEGLCKYYHENGQLLLEENWKEIIKDVPPISTTF